ncbi:MAG: hypothetical protein KC900_10015 [Candidatus Omnitrophica bacterium]|nr:hypothetical protein [Candidatus Omnitrophota bacterium]
MKRLASVSTNPFKFCGCRARRLVLIGTAALLLGYGQPASAADVAGYSIMGFPVDGAYPFAVVHVSSNLQTMANGFFQLAIRVKVNEPYEVGVEDILLRDEDRNSPLAYSLNREDESGAMVLRMSGARHFQEGQQLLIRFIVNGEPRTVTVGLLVQKIFM